MYFALKNLVIAALALFPFVMTFAEQQSVAATSETSGSVSSDASPIPGIPAELAVPLLAIGLDKDQRPAFGAQMQAFSGDLQSAVGRIMRGRSTDKPRAIKKRVKSLFKKLDEPMKSIVREDQWLRYLVYKKAYADFMNKARN